MKTIQWPISVPSGSQDNADSSLRHGQCGASERKRLFSSMSPISYRTEGRGNRFWPWEAQADREIITSTLQLIINARWTTA